MKRICKQSRARDRSAFSMLLKHIPFYINLRFSAFRLCLCSTVKIGSKREKLSLKTYISTESQALHGAWLFFIYATILSFSLTSGFATLTRTRYLLFLVLLCLCRKANKKTEVIPNEKSSFLYHKCKKQIG